MRQPEQPDQSDRSGLSMPLAARLRPSSVDEFMGQGHLLGHDKPLGRIIAGGILHSMILWGPPGTGKTTLAKLMANTADADFVTLSAISAGVKEIREIVETAKLSREKQGRETLLFIDEIHRFNKAQQDIFLPFVEEGVFTLVGATTENPSFELNNALLSRVRVYVLKSLSEDELLQVIRRAMRDTEKGLGSFDLVFPEELQRTLVRAADGDARSALNLLEVLAESTESASGKSVVTEAVLAAVIQQSLRRFDRQGDCFYEQISALHKSVRGSAPDAALYWLCRMLDGGCDPLYIARRVMRMASEDIGLADPRALDLAVNAIQVFERLGSPEGELAIAEAVVYLAVAPKSNAVYLAYKQAMRAAQASGSLEVPLHLRNAPTRLMKSFDYGHHYRYAHDEPDAYAAGESYFPAGMQEQTFYSPVPRGLEIKIDEKLQRLKRKDANYRDALLKK